MKHRLSLIILACALIAACRDSTSPPGPGAAGGSGVALSSPARSLISRSGVKVPPAAGHRLQERVIRAVAEALDDPALRSALFQRMKQSPHPEGKLHFSSLVADNSVPFGQAVVRSFKGSPPRLQEVLDSLMEFEIYLPVAEHRQAWNGGSNLMVAGVLDEDEEPVAFDVKGRQMRNVNRHAPPSTPVLVIVPLEQSLAPGAGTSRGPGGPSLATCGDDCTPPCQGASCGGTAGGGGGGSGGGGGAPGGKLRLSGIRIDDKHEPWWSGEPEFAVWVWAADGNGDPLLKNIQHPEADRDVLIEVTVAAGCVGEYQDRDSGKYWELNSEGVWWTAPYPQPLIFHNTNPNTNAGYRWDVVVVENDDDGRCPYVLPSLGNPSIFGNDDDLVGRMMLPHGLGPIDASSIGDVGRLVLRYGN